MFRSPVKSTQFWMDHLLGVDTYLIEAVCFIERGATRFYIKMEQFMFERNAGIKNIMLSFFWKGTILNVHQELHID